MALPQPVPSLDEADFAQIQREMEEFEMSPEQEEQIEKHMEALEEESG